MQTGWQMPAPKSDVLAKNEQYQRSAFEVLEEDAQEGQLNNPPPNKSMVASNALLTSNLM